MQRQIYKSKEQSYRADGLPMIQVACIHTREGVDLHQHNSQPNWQGFDDEASWAW